MAGISDPYTKTFLLRLLTALLALVAISFFYRSCRHLIKPEYRLLFLTLSYFLWFLPFLNVRFSSETWAGLVFLPVVSHALKENKSRTDFMWMGILAALSFLFRYQMAIAVSGLVLWLIIIKKVRTSEVFILIFSALPVLFIGLYVDYWFYGHFVVVPWNYFKATLWMGKVSEFGTSPWYYYFYYVFRFAFFPIGSVIILAFVVLVIKKPWSVFVWTILPFLVVHSFISHKELRFLFPFVNTVPVIVLLAFQEIVPEKVNSKQMKAVLVIGVLLGLINLSAMVVASIKPAGYGRIKITQRIWKKKEPVKLIALEKSNPYDPWGGLLAGFYLPSGLHFTCIESPYEPDSVFLENGVRSVWVLRKSDMQDPGLSDRLSGLGFQKADQSIPEYLMFPLKIYGGFKVEEVLVVYTAE